MKKLILICLLFNACSPEKVVITNGMSDIDKIKGQIEALLGTQTQIDNLINSDFKTCSGSGETTDALIRKICQVAQAANTEYLEDLKGQLAAYSAVLKSQLLALSDDVANQATSLETINASLATISSTIVSIQTNVTNLQSAVTTLQGQVASINTSLLSTMSIIDVGMENLSSGPLYESILKRADAKQFNGYVSALSTSVAVSSSGYAVVSASTTVTVTTSVVHGLVAGNFVRLSGATSNRGLTGLDVNGDFIVLTAPTTTTFTYASYHAATSTGTLGGNSAASAKITGTGLGRLWYTGDVSDVAVRQTILGSKSYNFIIRRKTSDSTKAEICYDKTNNAATFATINAVVEGGSGNISCK